MIENRDSHVNWELGWNAIYKQVKNIKKERDILEDNRVRPEDQLYDLRVAANHDPNSKQITHMKILEEEVRRWEKRSINL